MKQKKEGWVVIADKHPVTGSKYIVNETFSRLRKDAITKFCEGSNASWNYWRRKFNFKVVKASCEINI